MRIKVHIVPVVLAICLLLAGCGKKSVEEEAPVVEATPAPIMGTLWDGISEERVLPVSNVSDTLVGFILPESTDIDTRTAVHGFLRTAESLGYPAKLYYAPTGSKSVEAVEQAAAEGCIGLLIWNPGSVNKEAVNRADALSIKVIVPYHAVNDSMGIIANVVADTLGYAEEVALSIAERMVERECKAGKILVYGSDPMPVYDVFLKAVGAYYPQFNVGYFTRRAADDTGAMDELAAYILNNRDIKGLYCADKDGAVLCAKAREQAKKALGATATTTPKQSPTPSPAPTSTPAEATPSPAQGNTAFGGPQYGPVGPNGTPVPEGLIKSIVISVAGYGMNAETVAMVRTNDIYAFVLEPYYDACAQSMMLLDRALRGESVPMVMRLNMPIVRVSTLDKYVRIRQQVEEWFA